MQRSVFLNRTPLGVSLEMPSIIIGSSTPEPREGKIALQKRDDSSQPRPPGKCDKREFDESIKILECWLQEMGWKLQWYSSGDHIDAATLATRTVTLTKRQIPRHRYYSLLHECGHVQLLAGPPETRRGEPHGYLDLWYAQIDERTLRHRVAVVIDEVAAWDAGMKLAKRLGLGIDEQKYRDFRNRNLKSYFEWALDREES